MASRAAASTRSFWIHLSIGVAGLAVILLMCVTGVVLSFERQIVYAIDSWHSRAVVVPQSPRAFPECSSKASRLEC